MRNTCKTCKYMDKESGVNPFCRRYPAQLINNQQPDGIKLQALYPVVDPEKDWCGEHTVAEDETEKPEELN